MAFRTRASTAEWRAVNLLTVEGDMVNRGETIRRSGPRRRDRDDSINSANRRRTLENTASRVDQRFWAYFAARDWDAMAEMLADDFSI